MVTGIDAPASFLTIPSEVRLKILRLLLVCPIALGIGDRDIHLGYIDGATDHLYKFRIFPNIILTCQATYVEGLEVLYGENTLMLRDPGHNHTVLRHFMEAATMPKHKLNLIKHVAFASIEVYTQNHVRLLRHLWKLEKITVSANTPALMLDHADSWSPQQNPLPGFVGHASVPIYYHGLPAECDRAAPFICKHQEMSVIIAKSVHAYPRVCHVLTLHASIKQSVLTRITCKAAIEPAIGVEIAFRVECDESQSRYELHYLWHKMERE